MYMLLNWSLRDVPGVGVILTGNVINNIKFYSGQNITTSKIKEVCIVDENKQFNFMPKEIRKRKTKKVSRMNEITKIRVEIDERD